ncbi:FUSC family protein [Agromyces archimandritae]|uniref:FUSC family protein n=1 Tax=Agromyces archimandritae TaxID=2781962 RepID=A0A975FL65_9MICO|nr:FUSC family protein [Agromyces archimandritae]QTX03974.1 FUSC family protein [Agromyces archimandritae]
MSPAPALASGWRRLVESTPGIVQISVTALASWAFAHYVLGHPYPIIAAVVAITALGFVADTRPLRVLETVAGMTLGIALAELLLIAFGPGVVQYAVALVLTLSVARFVSATPGFAISAAVQCTLVMIMPAPDGGPFTRTIDALIGGAAALAATALIPRDAGRAAMRAGRRLIGEHAAVLDALADALAHGDAPAVEAVLERARTIDAAVESWRTAVDSGIAIARVSPFARRRRFDLERQRGMLTAMDLATRNLRVVARRSAWAAREGIPKPELGDLVGRVGLVAGILADSLDDVSLAAVARQSLSEIAKHLDPGRMLPAEAIAEQNVVHALRPYTVDLLQATGLGIDEARGRLAPL